MVDKNIFEKTNSWKIFDIIYSNYDRINRILSFGNDIRWRRKLNEYLPIKKNIHLLDVATGSADQILTLLKQPNHIKTVTGIDLSKKMLDLAKAKTHKYSNISFKLADAADLPFTNHSFDCITCSFGIRNIPNIEKALQEMHRTLKKNARLIILEFSLPKNRLFKCLYLFYLRKILPFIGGLFSKNFRAYSYLNKTIETFPYGESFCRLLQQQQFKNVRVQTLSFGAVSIYIADK